MLDLSYNPHSKIYDAPFQLKANNGIYLIDDFGRRVDYVRLSVTDRCDFRCVYCMSEHMSFLPKKELLTLEEMRMYFLQMESWSQIVYERLVEGVGVGELCHDFRLC